MAQCKATAKSTGQRCTQLAMKGMEVCRYHGGKSKKGAASGTFKHGKTSKHKPTRWAAEVAALESDPTIKSPLRNVARIEKLIQQKIDTLDNADAVTWKDSHDTWQDFLDAVALPTATPAQVATRQYKMDKAAKAHGEVVKAGYAVERTEDKIVELAGEQRKHQDSAHKQMIDLEMVATADEIKFLIGMSVHIIQKYVPQDQHFAIADEFNSVLLSGSLSKLNLISERNG